MGETNAAIHGRSRCGKATIGNEKRISSCPHCGNVAPQRVVHEHTTLAKEIDAAGSVTHSAFLCA
jgi:hypothetical protein